MSFFHRFMFAVIAGQNRARISTEKAIEPSFAMTATNILQLAFEVEPAT